MYGLLRPWSFRITFQADVEPRPTPCELVETARREHGGIMDALATLGQTIIPILDQLDSFTKRDKGKGKADKADEPSAQGEGDAQG